MTIPFDAQRTRALYTLGLIEQACQQYRELLTNAQNIRHEAWGTPYWWDRLRSAQEDIGRSLQAASNNATSVAH